MLLVLSLVTPAFYEVTKYKIEHFEQKVLRIFLHPNFAFNKFCDLLHKQILDVLKLC